MAEWDKRAKLLTRMLISLAVLTVCLLLVLGDFPSEHTKWAFGMIGVLVGYWLKEPVVIS